MGFDPAISQSANKENFYGQFLCRPVLAGVCTKLSRTIGGCRSSILEARDPFLSTENQSVVIEYYKLDGCGCRCPLPMILLAEEGCSTIVEVGYFSFCAIFQVAVF